jgi:hypothetical protein
MDSFCIPEDYKHDFKDIDESRRNFRDIFVRKKLDLGIFNIVEKHDLFLSARSAKGASWLWRG